MDISESIKPNTEEFETKALINRQGFREYDARWLYPQEVNLLGIQCIGAGISTQLWEIGQKPPRVIVGHDYREYSMAVKQALIVGLMSAGSEVHDIGLCITPMAYYARLALCVPGIAMVTASHNENGWTGIKVGDMHPLTHGPTEMQRLKEIVLAGRYDCRSGSYKYYSNFKEKYINSVIRGIKLKKRLKIVVATGNGTAGLFASEVLENIGCEIIKLHCELDWSFPLYFPNPENMDMLNDLRDEVIRTKADIGFAFDGDGDRLGVVDDCGNELFSDKLGLLIARYLSHQYKNARYIIDVKSTGLFMSDPILAESGATIEYWITGHSYMKRRVWEQKALAGFEKSGHFFFAEPIGNGYDDGLTSAVMVCKMLDADRLRLSEMRKALSETWQSPTMAPFCSENEKYLLVSRVQDYYKEAMTLGKRICNQNIRELITVNGIRVILEDGTWGLVRASSNKPSLVIVVESPISEKVMKEMFKELDQTIRSLGKVGDYDQVMA